MHPEGTWKVVAEPAKDGLREPAPGVVMSIERDGDAYSVRQTSEGGLGTTLVGVAVEFDGLLCVARGAIAGDAELDGTVGLVRYDLRTPGRLPARWYHPSLQGRVGEGLSSDGPGSGLQGEYVADYADLSGKPFNPLRKTVTSLGEDRFQL